LGNTFREIGFGFMGLEIKERPKSSGMDKDPKSKSNQSNIPNVQDS